MTSERAHLIPLTQFWSLWRPVVLRSAGLPFGLLEGLAMPSLLAKPLGGQRTEAIRAASSRAVADLVSNETFREAVTWQNPSAARTCLDSHAVTVASGPEARSRKRAYRERIVARYAQRYCAKNDSIGFFGPVAWAEFDLSEHGIDQHGSGGIRRRSGYLESWTMAALAGVWNHDDRLFEHLPVRIDPATTFAGGVLRRPRRRPEVCDPDTAALLAAIDGQRSCGEVLAATGMPPVALYRLREQGVVKIGFRVPYDAHPEAHLRSQVEELPDVLVRQELLGVLDDVVAARDAATRARGAVAVRTELDRLSDHFVKAGCSLGDGSRRSKYARTPAYLDCRRDTDVTIGGDLLEELRLPLSILLDSARWIAGEVADAVSAELEKRYRLLRHRQETVTLSDLQFAAADLLAPGGRAVAEVAEDFQLRWAEIMPGDTTGTVSLSSAEVRPLASALFPPPLIGWATARYHSPDLLLCRTAEGSWRWVLGELHIALNTLESRVFSTQCDDPAELVRATAVDLRRGRVAPLYPLDASEATARTYPPSALDPPGLYRYWSFASDDGHPDGADAVAATAVTVHEEDGQLVGRATDRGWAAPVLEFFGDFLTAATVNLFHIRPCRAHQPRLLIDNVVVARESWSLPASEIPLPGRNATDLGYQVVRDWAAGLGVPRHVFVRSPLEPKPFYVDFAAPLLLSNLISAIRHTRESSSLDVVLTEMLPAPGELWLSGPDGQLHTSEFRLVAVDGQDSERVVRRIRPAASGKQGSDD